MARKPNGTTKALSITLSVDNYATMEDYRWTVRKSFSDMMDEVVSFFIEKNGIERVHVAAPAGEPTTPAGEPTAPAGEPAAPGK